MNYTKDGTAVIDATGKEWPCKQWHPIPIPDGLEPRAIEQGKIDSHPVIIFWDHWLVRPPLPKTQEGQDFEAYAEYFKSRVAYSPQAAQREGMFQACWFAALDYERSRK